MSSIVSDPAHSLSVSHLVSESSNQESKTMKIAIPLADGKLCMHFGQCEQFTLIDVDDVAIITGKTLVSSPPHESGLLPKWLSGKGVTQIIADGMGQRAQEFPVRVSDIFAPYRPPLH